MTQKWAILAKPLRGAADFAPRCVALPLRCPTSRRSKRLSVRKIRLTLVTIYDCLRTLDHILSFDPLPPCDKGVACFDPYRGARCQHFCLPISRRRLNGWAGSITVRPRCGPGP